MPILHEPAIDLEGVRIRSVSLSSLDLEVAIRVQNENPVGVTLKELPFVVLFRDGEHQQEIAQGNTGTIRIPARSTTVLTVPVTSGNTALIRAMAAFVARGRLEVTIQGIAVVDAGVTGWSVPFEKPVNVTATGVSDAITGQLRKMNG